MTSILYEILKQGHYIAVVTNGTVIKRFQKINQFLEGLKKKAVLQDLVPLSGISQDQNARSLL